MAIHPIIIWGDPVLHRPAEPVTKFDSSLRQLVSDMFEVMYAAPGVGLAAPQIGVGLRLFVYGWTDEEGTEHKGVAVNPELWLQPMPKADANIDEDSEGCLSVPGERYPTKRSRKAILRAYDAFNNYYEKEASGWLARIWQHEFDHLNGIIYVDRLDFMEKRSALKEISKKGWGHSGNSWMPGVDHPEG